MPINFSQYKMNIENKLLVDICAISNYAAPVWSYASNSNIKILTCTQNSILREITNVPSYFRNNLIYEELKILPIPNFHQSLSTKFYKNISNEIINNSVN